MKILLTGKDGFIGNSIYKWLITQPHIVFAPTHQEVDLTNLSQIITYLSDKKIDIIIHTAYICGKRLKHTTANDSINNLLMTENLLSICHKTNIRLINLGSGGEFDAEQDIHEAKEDEIFKIVPKNYDNFTKSLIAKRVLNANDNHSHLRIWGIFGTSEDDNRFIKNTINSILQHKNIIIHQNKWFDFIFIDDFIIILNAIINNPNLPKNINCVYNKKYTLFSIALLIRTIANSNTPIIVENNKDGLGLNYTGSSSLLNNLSLPLVGLEQGIKKMYMELLCS